LSSLLSLFLDNLLPILLAAATGYFITHWRKVDPHDLSLVTFNIFSPCLIFNILTHNELGNGEILQMIGFGFLVMILVGLVAWAGGRLLKLDRKMQAALLITTMFMNAGNYGMPLAQFVFGDQGLAYASLYFVSMVMLSYTVGVLIVSMGSMSLPRSLLNLAKVPTIYALVLALLSVETGWRLPLPLDRVIGLLGDAAIPMMLIILGVQLQQVHWSGAFKPVVLATSIKLVIAPLIAIGVNMIYGLQGVAQQAGILQSGMPTAVMTIVLATEFDTEPAFVTAVVFTGTIVSVFTLTPLLAYLGG
jgi:malate permease and related proteins